MLKKVMVIDDNKVDRYVAEVVMTRNHFAEQVVSLESAQDGLDYLVANANNGDALPQLIFLDINMPFMSGFDFLDEYDKLPENIKKNCIIMMLTTSLNDKDRERGESNKYVCRFLNKPFTKEKVEELGVIAHRHLS